MVEIGNLKRVYDETDVEEFESEFVDKDIHCVDCEESFVWTIGEQTFFRDKGLVNPPKRCKICKQAKNKRLSDIQRAQETGVKQKVEVSVNCAKCETRTTVPFYPSQGRPVFCRSCFLDMNPAVLTSNNGNE
jgi:CxxC-x17-CxxC domain-containing protein